MVEDKLPRYEPLDDFGRRYPYTIVGILEKASRGSLSEWQLRAGNVIREVSNNVYEYVKQRHNLI